ncbi:unnamed protein product [Adineta steineri]|uniref:Uncharacterized protein n=1 Tax=Adineta steineri TaxID=433720 RepID=A0A814APJ9_9BILA|nr:unnamed protein product [Adineta steineri]CAF0916551.1 unnamed protein product [Adineta steineri]
MPDLGKISLIAAAAISAFSLLLLIISVATPVWLDDGTGVTVGLFKQCLSVGCVSANQVTQGVNTNHGIDSKIILEGAKVS